MNSKQIHLCAAAVIMTAALALAAAPADAQTETDVNYTWTAPTAGSAVVGYVVEHSVDGGAWTGLGTVATNQFTLTATYGSSHQIRVAGVDNQGRQGPWSEPSDPFVPDVGPPGQPGKPIIFRPDCRSPPPHRRQQRPPALQGRRFALRQVCRFNRS